MQRSSVLGEGRRVENDQVVAVAHAVEIFECVLTESLVSGVAWEVHIHIACGELNCLCATIDRMYQFGSSSHGIEGESACVAEHVQHLLSLGEAFKQRAVLTLVNKESCLLSLQPVNVELQSVFHRQVVVATSDNESVFLS